MSKPMPLDHFLFGLQPGDRVKVVTNIAIAMEYVFSGYKYQNDCIGLVYNNGNCGLIFWWIGSDEIGLLDHTDNVISRNGNCFCYYPEP
jgi:hypothetical protein